MLASALLAICLMLMTSYAQQDLLAYRIQYSGSAMCSFGGLGGSQAITLKGDVTVYANPVTKTFEVRKTGARNGFYIGKAQSDSGQARFKVTTPMHLDDWMLRPCCATAFERFGLLSYEKWHYEIEQPAPKIHKMVCSGGLGGSCAIFGSSMVITCFALESNITVTNPLAQSGTFLHCHRLLVKSSLFIVPDPQTDMLSGLLSLLALATVQALPLNVTTTPALALLRRDPFEPITYELFAGFKADASHAGHRLIVWEPMAFWKFTVIKPENGAVSVEFSDGDPQIQPVAWQGRRGDLVRITIMQQTRPALWGPGQPRDQPPTADILFYECCQVTYQVDFTFGIREFYFDEEPTASVNVRCGNAYKIGRALCQEDWLPRDLIWTSPKPLDVLAAVRDPGSHQDS
ncbi:uncharacterized protein L969DRAFT_103884 [Mixia osmundae IAM 14324]|uniref:uncharacterized protein n=1 Tax=Mixia osmundae (strain CBS 9802 / IAM 14324 / JCM 22182 / KY 12970) TaxID=764103 RepID=UPI0004A54C1D|nr:uncharacterized protein L969DRAFT_103884 [Mixia osmundae IAM 14324]KEI38891.1 hypothetical protein L969DRAFT_103884 [Mixia osmundae IAM 14324]